jgi:hypothetical protein
MSAAATERTPSPWSRPQLERSGPKRVAGGLYRTSDDGRNGISGVPLVAVDDAVGAAVRMAYRVAEAQIDRSTQLARRLRQAGDRAVGGRSDRKAVDATEQLIFKAAMSALSWLERSAAEPDPVKRFASAQYQLVGSVLGLTPSLGGLAVGEATRRAGAALGSAMSEAMQAHRQGSQESAAAGAEGSAVSTPPPAEQKAPATQVTIILKGRSKRHVRVRDYQAPSGKHQPNIQFYSVADIRSSPIKADLAIDAGGRATLAIETSRLAKPGLWKAAVHDARGVQLGVIEIEL